MISTAQAITALEHRDPCTRGSTKTIRDPSGRVFTVCLTCSARLWHDQPPTVQAPPVDTAFRCRTHLAQTVTWRGTGCTACATEARKRAKRRDRPPATELAPSEWSFTDD